MPDTPPLAGIDADRPLPVRLRARLEGALIDGELGAVDAPHPLPAQTRSRIEGSMAEAAAEMLRGAASPRPMPPRLRARIEASIARPPRNAFGHRALAAAAVVLLLVGSITVVAKREAGAPRRSDIAAPLPTESATPGAPAATPPAAAPVAPAPSLAPPGAPGVRDPSSGTADEPGNPPPFSLIPGMGSSFLLPGSPDAPPAAPRARPALGIGTVAGDSAQEAGFRAYVDLVNRSGGVRHRRLNVIAAGPSRPAPGTVVTVNLSGHALATDSGPPSWAYGPLLETIGAPGQMARGRVFSVSSDAARQARLAVARIFPDAMPAGTFAAVYHEPSGPFAAEVRDAFEAALRARNVTPVRSQFGPGDTPIFLPADAAFLSLGPQAAGEFLAAARAEQYATRQGIAGIYSLFDPRIASVAPEGVLVMSPYRRSHPNEMAALERALGRPADAAAIHGWVTAKLLAMTIYRTDASTPSALQDALETTTYEDMSFAPYKVSPPSHARAPHAIALVVEGGILVEKSEFLTDAS